MTATIRQVQANQKNAEKSTGPRTEEGKAVSKANAVKHGLCSEGVLPEEQAEFEQLLRVWRETHLATYVCGQADREQTFREMVLQVLRIRRAQRREFELIDEAKARARHSWEIDRRREAEQIGETLSRKPGLCVARLRCFSQGCEWLIERWEHLEAAISEAGKATPEQASKIFDLLGAHPLERREFPDGLPAERALPLIKGSLETLRTYELPALLELNEDDRGRAERGFQAETPREELLNRRYENLAQKRFDQTRKALLACAAMPIPSIAVAPAPTTAPTSPASATPPAPIPNSTTVKTANPSSTPAVPASAPARIPAATHVAASASAPAPIPARNEPVGTMGKMGGSSTPVSQQRSA